MIDNCIFCKIINKTIPSVTIYEDDLFIAILDKFPTAKYHILVIPKNHEENIFTASCDTKNNILEVVSKICKALQKLGINDINILQNNGENAGQTVNHFHIHIIPRFTGDKEIINFYSKEEDDVILLKYRDDINRFL